MGKLLDALDISAFVPKLGFLLAVFWFVLIAAVLLPPAFLLIKGYFCYFVAPHKRENKWAFRTFFCNKSEAAWQFTQKCAGLVFGGLGAVLALVMLIVCIVTAFFGLSVMARVAVICLIWEIALTVLAYIAVMLAGLVVYDNNGDFRR